MTGAAAADEGKWLPHPYQVDNSRGGRSGLAKYLAGPVIAHKDFEDGYRSRPCIVTPYCAGDNGKDGHEKCWQADGVAAPDHSLDDCRDAHRLRCRCTCHDAITGGVLF